MYDHLVEEIVSVLSKRNLLASVDGVKAKVAEAIKKDFLCDKIGIFWTLDDVRSAAEDDDLTDEQCYDALQEVLQDFSAEQGVGWEEIRQALGQ